MLNIPLKSYLVIKIRNLLYLFIAYRIVFIYLFILYLLYLYVKKNVCREKDEKRKKELLYSVTLIKRTFLQIVLLMYV